MVEECILSSSQLVKKKSSTRLQFSVYTNRVPENMFTLFFIDAAVLLLLLPQLLLHKLTLPYFRARAPFVRRPTPS